MNITCPFCKLDPFHYVDTGVAMVPAAVNCCDLGYELIQKGSKVARKTLYNMQSHSPRKKARAMKVLREAGLRKPHPKEKYVKPEGL